MPPLHSYLPVALRISGRTVVVIGGDEEAAAKVRKLLPLNCNLIVISAAVTPEIALSAARGELRWIRRPYQPGDLRDVLLAFICDASLAASARHEAATSGVLLNVLDRPELSDVNAVAFFDRAGLQIGVHSSGQSAALSRRIRERLEAQFGEGYGDLVQTLGTLRPLIRSRIASPGARRALWLEVVNQRLLDDAESGSFCPPDFTFRVENALKTAMLPHPEETGHA